MRLDAEREVAQDLRPQAVAQADVLESDHARLRSIPVQARGTPGRQGADLPPRIRSKARPCKPKLRFYRIIAAPP